MRPHLPDMIAYAGEPMTDKTILVVADDDEAELRQPEHHFATLQNCAALPTPVI